MHRRFTAKFFGLLKEWSRPRSHDAKLVRHCDALTAKEISKEPKRYDIINELLSYTSNKRYLEIGVRNPSDCFEKIHASEKFSVDPGLESKINQATFQLTSDSFFQSVKDRSIDVAEKRFGVIFLDGLHLAEQAYRDILHSMEILDSPGFLVVHDCNPPTIYHAREDYRDTSPAGPYWNGTTWKSFVKFRAESKNLCLVIDSDWGVGVICKHLQPDLAGPKTAVCDFYEYNTFHKFRKILLNLVTMEEAREILSATNT